MSKFIFIIAKSLANILLTLEMFKVDAVTRLVGELRGIQVVDECKCVYNGLPSPGS
jgi:hypothetical protein